MKCDIMKQWVLVDKRPQFCWAALDAKLFVMSKQRSSVYRNLRKLKQAETTWNHLKQAKTTWNKVRIEAETTFVTYALFIPTAICFWIKKSIN